MLISPIEKDIWKGIALFLFGAIVNHVWSRYRTRLKRLRWSAWHHRIAVAAEDPHFGRVDVLYEGQPVINVHSSQIQIENESNSDLTNVVINIAHLDGTRIYRSMGAVEGSLAAIPFTDAFSAALADFEHADANYLITHRDYRIPVLNRGTKVSFFLLVGRDHACQPLVTVSCDHVGVELKFLPPSYKVFGVPFQQAQVVGLAATFAFALALAWWLPYRWIISLAAWLVGVFALALGAGFTKLWKWILRQVG